MTQQYGVELVSLVDNSKRAFVMLGVQEPGVWSCPQPAMLNAAFGSYTVEQDTATLLEASGLIVLTQFPGQGGGRGTKNYDFGELPKGALKWKIVD